MYRRILVPLVGSERSESALHIALELAQSQAAEIILVRVPVDVLLVRAQKAQLA